ncbi:MAG: hypothetical protein ABIJ52_16435 [Pseudomonadota bacterium]
MKIAHKKLYDFLFSLVMGACFVLFACPTVLGDNSGLNTLSQNSEQNLSTVTVNNVDNTVIYSISAGDCTIEWIARNSEIGVIKHRTRCTVPLSQQLPLLTQICTEFFSKDKNTKEFRTLFWGRLTPDGSRSSSQELSLRLALAAHKSPGWDVKRGKPKNGDINGFVKDLANRANIYPELKELFERFHKSIKFSCAEKVLVSKAEKLPFFDQLKQHGIKASDKLPFDCLTWFSISELISD